MRGVCVHDATRAEYDRFGGVVISMARRSKSPARLFYLKNPIPVLLLRANDLVFGARSAKSLNLGPWGTEV